MPLPIEYRQTASGSHTLLNITATTQIVTGQGHVYRVFVNTAPTAAGGVYDSASTSTLSASNLLAAIPSGAVGPIDIDCEIFNGLVINPGTSGVVAASFDPARSF